MKRLEHIRTLRNQASRFAAKTSHGAVMVLAQMAQEKQRLLSERGNWERRLQKIDHRLAEIAVREQQLCALTGLAGASASSPLPGDGASNGSASNLPPGFTEMTVQY